MPSATSCWRTSRTYLRRTAESTAAIIDDQAHARLRIRRRPVHRDIGRRRRRLRVLLRTNPDIRFAYSGIVRGDTMYYVLDGDTTSQAAHHGARYAYRG
ncbi:MAG: hypothetical protein IPN16_16035 [Gemmatimonadetes bacterium]|nr:hypothetical protein [Gemmatimonadota bacterium]